MELGAVLALRDKLSGQMMKASKSVRNLAEKAQEASQMVKSMPKNTKVMIQAKDAATPKIQKVNTNLKGINGFLAQPTIDVDAIIMTKLENIRNRLVGMSKLVVSPLVRLKDEATAKVQSFEKKAEKIKNMVISPFIKFKDEALKKIPDIQHKLNNLSRFVAVPAILLQDKASKVIQSVKDKVTDLSGKLKGIAGKVFNPIVRLKDEAAAKLEELKFKLKAIGMKVFTPIIKAKDQVSTTLGNIKDKVLNLKTLLAGLVIGGAGAKAFDATLGGAMQLENQTISMEHFIGINNKDKSAEQIKAITQSFMNALEVNANSTPFETGEVIAAGTRAVGIADGNTTGAMKLVKLAEDMAALTPGKTISDAMEALADAKMGEFERMKEFNMKFSKEQLDSVGFDGFFKEAQSKFQGGAEKLAQSATGLWSTITGSMKSGFTKMGKGGLELLKPQLKELADLFSNEDFMNKFIAKGSEMVSKVVGAGIKLVNWFRQNWPTISGVFKSVWSVVGPIIGFIGDAIQWLGGFIAKHKNIVVPAITAIGVALLALTYGVPAIMGIASAIGALFSPVTLVIAAIALLYTAWVNNWGGMQEKVKAVIDWMMPYIQGIISFFSSIDWGAVWNRITEEAGPILNGLFNVITQVFGTIGQVIQTSLAAINQWWQKHGQSILTTVTTIFTGVWTLISQALSVVVNIVQQALTIIAQWWQQYGSSIINFVMSFVGSIIGWIGQLFAFIQPVIQTALFWIQKIWNDSLSGVVQNVLAFVGKLVEAVTAIWNNFISPIVGWLVGTLGPIFSNVFQFVIDIVGNAINTIAGVLGGIFKILGGVIDFITGIFTGNWSKAWEGIKSIFGGIWDSIGSILKGVLNGIISAVNVVIRGLNKLKVPDWVPVIGGSGINIPEIPMLASGGVVNHPTLAMVGEAGPEAVIPLDKIAETMQAVPMKQELVLPAELSQKLSSPSNRVEPQRQDYSNLEASKPQNVTNTYTSNSTNNNSEQSSTTKKSIIIKNLIGKAVLHDEADEDRLVNKILDKLADDIDEAAMNSGEVDDE
mgnify:CR=1 FL=1